MKTKQLIPLRVIVGLLGCTGCLLLYVIRSNLSLAIIAMVNENDVIASEDQTVDNDLCFDIKSVDKNDSNSGLNGKYLWSNSVQGLVLGSYFYGLPLTQFLGSYSDKFGAKWIVTFGVFTPAIFNALIPVLADIHYSYVIVMRVLMGAFHGVVYSSMFSMFSKWFPVSEKTLAITGTMLFGNFGGVISMPIVGYLSKVDFLEGWPTAFYLTSLLHIFWLIFWLYFVSNTPEESRLISGEELDYIMKNNPNSKIVKNLSIPWGPIFTSRVVWASIALKMSAGFGYFLLCTKMPTYLDTVFGMSIQSNSWFNSLLYLTICTTNLIASPLSNWIKSKGWFSTTRNRKNFQSFAMLSPAICLLLVPIVGCNSGAAIALLLTGMFGYGFCSGGEFAIIPEYALNYSGTVFGICNTFAVITGFMGPLLVGLLLDYGDGSGVRHQWNTVWYITAGIYAFGGIVFEMFGTAEPQPWTVSSHKAPVDENKNKITDNNISKPVITITELN